MSRFSTEFPIDQKNSVADVLRLACKWIAGSPHTKMRPEDLEEIPKDGERTCTSTMEHVTLASAVTADFDTGGLRYVRTEAELEWTTSVVSLRTQDKHLVSLQVACQALNAAARLPPPKKPVILRLALEELGGGMDGEIPVAAKPIYLSDNEESIAAELMLGTAKNTLPIVYISAAFKGQHLVNTTELSEFLSGLAHVVVEPSRRFSLKLKPLVRSRNVFGGTVGVYWPASQIRNVYFVDMSKRGAKSVQVQIAKDIRVALSNRRQLSNCNWPHLQETVARKKLDALKASGSTELQAFIEAFDEEMSAKDSRLEELNDQVARLTAECRRLGSAGQTTDGGIVASGEEQDLYEGEISDIVAEALQESLRNSKSDSRRQHVLNDLVAANNPSGEGKRIAEEIKSLFRTYRDMDAKTRNTLNRLGFDLTEEGKHYKAVFQGDPRYTFSLPKTSSDHRAGMNLTSDINSTLF